MPERTTTTTEKMNGGGGIGVDELSLQLRDEAERVLRDEPELCYLLKNTVLAENVETFEDAVAQTVCFRLLLQPCNNNKNNSKPAPHASNGGKTATPNMFCPSTLKQLIRTQQYGQ